MNSLVEFVEHLVRPIEICVIDDEEETCHQIESALNVYNCDVKLSFEEITDCRCLRDKLSGHADLVFVSADLRTERRIQEVVDYVEQTCPEASVVILTRNPTSSVVVDLMKSGSYIFLVKNGSFDDSHIRKIFRQLNMKLRSKAEKCCEQV
jgi:DNA-binding NtrC family response regulator